MSEGLPAVVSRIVDVLDPVDALLRNKSPATLRAYDADLRDFARFVGVSDVRDAGRVLLQVGQGPANAVAGRYRSSLEERGLAPATVARRLAALRALVQVARTLGLVAWSLDVAAPRVVAYRDTRGPGDDGWARVLELLRERARDGGPRELRDLAMMRLIHDLGLRRGEAISLDLAHVEAPNVVWVAGKGHAGVRTRLVIPAATLVDLNHWLVARGKLDGPLFISWPSTRRYTGRGLAKRMRLLGVAAGLARPLRPHGLRHHAITRALDLTRGDVRLVQRFSRHARPETLLRYDDARRDDASRVADLVADG